MKNSINVIVMLTLLTCVITGLSFSQPITWTEYPSNPIFGQGTIPAGPKAYYPSVVYDQNSFSGHGDAYLYKMWYNSASGTGLAYSNDGITWTDGVNPVTGLTGQGAHATIKYYEGGFVGVNSGTNPSNATMYYRVWYWPGLTYTINDMRYAESSDGTTWNNDQPLVNGSVPIITGTNPDWNRGSYGPADILYNPGASNTGTDWVFTMYYDGTTGGTEVLGLAFSANGITWTGYDANSDGAADPILTGSGSGWDATYVSRATVLKLSESDYRMWYSGGVGTMNHGIGIATSADGINWTKSASNPIFHKDNGVAWRNERTYCPAVLKVGDTFKMWFAGRNTAGNYSLGYATGQLPAVHNLTQDTYFITIQAAINAANTADVITVGAGTYNETLTFSSAFATNNLTIQGSGTSSTFVTGGINFQNSGVVSGLTFKDFALSGTGGASRTINGGNPGLLNNLTFDNLELDGDNSGAIQVAFYVFNVGGTLTINNCRIQDYGTTDAVVYLGAGLTVKYDLVFNNNTLTNCGGGCWILALDDVTASYNTLNNIAKNVGNGPTALGFYGDWNDAGGMTPSGTANVHHNTFSNCEEAGMAISGFVNATVSDNVLVNCSSNPASSSEPRGRCLLLKNLITSNVNNNNVTMPSNSSVNPIYGIIARGTGTYSFSGNVITSTGVITGSVYGMMIYGGGANTTLNIGNTSFDGYLPTYILTYGPNTVKVDATNAIFNGSKGSSMSLAELFSTEDKIIHYLDNNTKGLVFVKSSNLYVTPNSGSIQRGIEASSTTITVNVASGTFNEMLTFSNLTASGMTVQGGDPNNRPEVTGGVWFTNTTNSIDGLTLKDLLFKGDANPNTTNQSIIYMSNTGAVNNLVIDHCVLDGENIGVLADGFVGGGGRHGFVGNKLGGTFTVTNSEFKNILGWVLLDMDASSDYTPIGGNGLALSHITFSNNTAHDCNGTVALRGNHTSRTPIVDVTGNSWDNIGGAAGYQGAAWAAIEINNATQVNFQNNVINDVQQGFYGEGQATQMWNVETLNFTDNTITNNFQGVYYYSDGVGGTFCGSFGCPVPAGFISNNSFTGNTEYGISVNPSASGGPLNAESNWWGTIVESEIQAKVNGPVDFDPWTGKAMQQPITSDSTGQTVEVPNTDVALTFNSLPPGTNATVTVQQTPDLPAGVPAPPSNAGTVAPLYLQIGATGLTNGTFNVTVTIDVSGISGFNANTLVMYYSTISNSWVSVTGTYDAGPPATFTFTTDHFTPFAFVNPTNPDDLYLTVDNTSPSSTIFYPQVGMGSGTTYGADDWTYTTPKCTLYVVPTGTQSFVAANFTVLFDATKASVSASAGDMFAGGTFFTSTPAAGQLLIETSNLNQTMNVAPGSDKYLAKLIFTLLKPGYNSVTLDGIDVRYYDAVNDNQASVYITSHPGAMKFYLGDFATASVTTSGDGLINFNDLSPFSLAYWSESDGSPAGYKAKFDIGPTNSGGSYFAMPTPDGAIEFEDLVIFSIGYGKSAAGQLPKEKPRPVTLALGQSSTSDDVVRVPITLNGEVNDIRAFSLTARYTSTMKYVGVEKAGELATEYGFMMEKSENGTVRVDAAIIGSEHEGISKSGTVGYLLFSGTGKVELTQAKARDSWNREIVVTLKQQNTQTPTAFALGQNYPNPFNPTTTIKYDVPVTGYVELTVYTMLGEEVATLVRGEQTVGSYEMMWNGKNNRGETAATGIYLYKMRAGEFLSVKKMMLIK